MCSINFWHQLDSNQETLLLQLTVVRKHWSLDLLVQVAYCLDLFAQEVGFFLITEALESLFRGKNVFLSYQQAFGLFNRNK